jgi:hypothetical protein
VVERLAHADVSLEGSVWGFASTARPEMCWQLFLERSQPLTCQRIVQQSLPQVEFRWEGVAYLAAQERWFRGVLSEVRRS